MNEDNDAPSNFPNGLPEETQPPAPSPPSALETPLDTYKTVVRRITEMAEDPEFRTQFKAYLEKINPDGDELVSGQELSNFYTHMLVETGNAYNQVIAKEIAEGHSPEEIAKALEEVGFTKASDTGTPQDYSFSAHLEMVAAECRQAGPVDTTDPAYQQFQEIIKNYSQIVTALQIRSSFVGDLLLSEESKALIPKLNPTDAYSLPLFVQMPTQEQNCHAIDQAAKEASLTDPLRPLDTPTAPADRDPTQAR